MTLEDFQKIFVFSVTSELIKGLHPDARSLLQLSIPVNKPVISLTTVVQKQTVLGLHMYKMHILFFLSVMFLTCSTIVTKIVHFSREPLL